MLIRGYTNLNVQTKTGLGGTKICFDALTNNQIDFYPEYTGTGLLVVLNTPQKIVDTIIHKKIRYMPLLKLSSKNSISSPGSNLTGLIIHML